MANSVNALELTTFNTAGLAGSYTAINTGFAEPIVILRLINTSSNAITISYDGTTDHEYLPSNSTIQLSFATNSIPNAKNAQMKKGTIVYAKGTAGAGTLAIAGYYV